jgi:integrase
MPYRQKDTAYWWISYTDATGRRIRRSSGTENHADAKAEEQKLRSQSHTTRRKSGGSVDVSTILAEYLKRDRLSPRNKSIARALADHFAGSDAVSLDSAAIYAYVDHRRHLVSDSTIRRDLTLLSAAINEYNKRHGTHLPNPTRSADVREPEGRVRWITTEEAERLISCASPVVADFIKIGLYTGMRSGEILGLTWDRVDFERSTIRLESVHTKTKRSRTIPLHPTAKAGLKSCKKRWPESAYVFVIDSVKKGFAGACKRAGISDFHPHDLRHTCASWLVQKGVSLYEVRDILGHSSIKLTERYSHLAPENLAGAIAKLKSL